MPALPMPGMKADDQAREAQAKFPKTEDVARALGHGPPAAQLTEGIAAAK